MHGVQLENLRLEFEYFTSRWPDFIGGIISEQNRFIFPGQFTLKLVLFAASKKY